MLINNGSGTSFITAPYQPATRDYSITANLSLPGSSCSNLQLISRATPDGNGDAGEYNQYQGLRIQTPGNTNANWYSYSPGSNKFTMSLQVKGTTIQLFLNTNKSPIETLVDTSRTDPGLVGLYADSCQVQVFSFEVTAL